VPYDVLEAQWLTPNVRRLLVRAPHIVRNYKPGQFVIVRAGADGERIPLTVAEADKRAGTILLIVQRVGATTSRLCALDAGQRVCDVAGPLGRPTHIAENGRAVLVGGGVGTAVIFPQARALKDAGNHVVAIVGARTQSAVILEKELSRVCDDVHICTDDGSYGFHGFVTDRLRTLITESDVSAQFITEVICAGPVPMMRAVAELTRPWRIHTIASLNPIMVDGTGMCGGCRVVCENKTQFACVDGPEFDAHQVDFSELAARLIAYGAAEKAAMERHACRQRSA
jgi:ferredoxin--NADP+ reductase